MALQTVWYNYRWKNSGEEDVNSDSSRLPLNSVSFRSSHSSISICILVPSWLSLFWQFNHFMSFFQRQGSLLSTMHFTPEAPHIMYKMSRTLVALRHWTLQAFQMRSWQVESLIKQVCIWQKVNLSCALPHTFRLPMIPLKCLVNSIFLFTASLKSWRAVNLN